MTLRELLTQQSFDNSLLLGFYGGGNYGDELLLEVLLNLLSQQQARNIAIAYQDLALYGQYHHEFGYPRVLMRSLWQLCKALFQKKRIIVGGGGLWGMDMNRNILMMSALLFLARWLLGKEVYLLGVGYYNSTTRSGRAAAWLAAKAATVIIARDDESYANFARFSTRTYQDADIAWQLRDMPLDEYLPDVAALEQQLDIRGKTICLALRRFRPGHASRLQTVVQECLQANRDKPVILMLLEPKEIDPAGYQVLLQLQNAHPAAKIIDFQYNPLALFLLFRRHSRDLIFIGPQFHAILSAHLTGVPYLPISYDNKVRNLLAAIAPSGFQIPIQSLTAADTQVFINNLYNPASA